MADFPYFHFFPADWVSSPRIVCATPSQRGGYIQLLSYCWLSGDCSLPAEDAALMAMSGLALGDLNIIRSFFILHPNKEGYLTNERLLAEWERAKVYQKSQSEKGKKSGKSREKKRRTEVEPELNRSRNRTRTKREPNMNHVTSHKSQVTGHKAQGTGHTSQGTGQEEGDCGGTPAESPATAEVVSPSVEAWLRYEAAYLIRWKTKPVRNAKVNGQLAMLVARVGKDAAPGLAEWYLSHNGQVYVKYRHPVWALLKDCESLHTQWKTGVKATTLEAKQAEFKDSLKGQYEQAMEILTQEESS